MNRVSEIINKYGEDFDIDPKWKYHFTYASKDFVSIFQRGILCRKKLIELGIKKRNFMEYDGDTEMSDKVSLATKSNLGCCAYESFIKYNDAVIVSGDIETILSRTYKEENKGFKRFFQKEKTITVPVSIFSDEVQVQDIIEPQYLLGLKIGRNEKITINISNLLLENNISIKLYDFNTKKVLYSDQLVKRLSL